MTHEDKAREIVADYGARWFRAPLEVQEQEPWLAERITTALQEAAGEWYRIDDPEHPAPKDGTAILVFCPDAIEPQIFIAIYVRWDNSATGEAIGEDWIDLGNEQQIDAEITHWRPLPPPPSDKGGA